jgi:hypothetical protein
MSLAGAIGAAGHGLHIVANSVYDALNEVKSPIGGVNWLVRSAWDACFIRKIPGIFLIINSLDYGAGILSSIEIGLLATAVSKAVETVFDSYNTLDLTQSTNENRLRDQAYLDAKKRCVTNAITLVAAEITTRFILPDTYPIPLSTAALVILSNIVEVKYHSDVLKIAQEGERLRCHN